MKGSIYPFKIRIQDPVLANTLKILSKRRAVKVVDVTMANKIKKKLKPVRRDIFWGPDRRYSRSFIALDPKFDMDFTFDDGIYVFEIKPII